MSDKLPSPEEILGKQDKLPSPQEILGHEANSSDKEMYKAFGEGLSSSRPSSPFQSDEGKKPSKTIGAIIDILSAPARAFHDGIKGGAGEVKEGVKRMGSINPIENLTGALQATEGVAKGVFGVMNLTVPAVAAFSAGMEATQKGAEALPTDPKSELLYGALLAMPPGTMVDPQHAIKYVTQPITTALEDNKPQWLNNPMVAAGAGIADMALPLAIGILGEKGKGGLAKDIQEGKPLDAGKVKEAVGTVQSASPKEVADISRKIVVDHLDPDIAHLKDKEIKLHQDAASAAQVLGNDDAAKLFQPEIEKTKAEFQQQAQNLTNKNKLEQAKEAIDSDEGKSIIDEHLKTVQDNINKLAPKNDALKNAETDLEKEGQTKNKEEDASKIESTAPLGEQPVREESVGSKGSEGVGQSEQGQEATQQSEEKITSPTPEATTNEGETKINQDGKEEKNAHETEGQKEDVLTSGAEPINSGSATPLEEAKTIATEHGYENNPKKMLNSIESNTGERFMSVQDALKSDNPKVKEFLDNKKNSNLAENEKGSKPTAKEKSPTQDSGRNKAAKTPIRRIGTPKARRKIRDPRYLEALKKEPRSPYDAVLQHFINGGEINRFAIKELFEGGGKKATGEYKSKFGILGKDAPSIKELAHGLWEDRPEGDDRFTDQDYREAVEQVLLDHNGRKSMVDEILKKNNSDIPDQYATEHDGYDSDIIQHAEHIYDNLSEEEFNKIHDENVTPEYLQKIVEDDLGGKSKLDQAKDKIAKGVNGIADKLGARKFLNPEEKTKLYDDLKNIVSGLIEAGSITAKEAMSHVADLLKNAEWYKNLTDKSEVDKVVEDVGKSFEEKKEPKSITGIKNAQVDEERANRGFAPAMTAARKEMGESWDEAMKLLEEDPDRQNNLIEELKKKPRPLSDVENSILLHKQIELQNEYETVNENINKARENKDYGIAEENRLRLARISDDLQDVYNVGKAVGTENARGLNTRKMMAAEDYSLAAMETQKRAANRGEKLSPKQEDEIRTLHEKIQSTQKAFDDYVKQAEDRISKAEAQAKIEGSVREARKTKRSADKQNIRAERETIINSIKDKLKAQRSTLSANPISVDLLPDVAKLVKNYAQEGVLKLDDFVDKIHDDLKDIIGGLSKRDVRDAISGYGYDKGKQTLSELTTQVTELKKQARLASRLEDLEAGRVPAKTERAKINQSKEIEELKKQIKTKEGKEKIKQRTEALQKKIDEGDFTTKKRQTTPLDNEALLLKAKNERAKQEFKLGLEKDRIKQESRVETAQRWFVKIERAGKLSSPLTLGKLTSAAITRQMVTPLEEGVGSLWGNVFPSIAEGAPREAGMNVKAEAKALTEAWTKGLKDSYDVLKTGKSDLDVVYGKSKLPPEAIDFFGKLHGALKTTAKRGEFARSFEKRSAYKINQGVDMTDPLAQLQTGIEAFKDAQRSIFLQDNKVANWWTDQVVGGLERSKLKGAATIANWLVPFVKIPTNIVSETTTYATGLPRGLAKATYEIMTDGIDNMTPDEKDHTLRMLKKGSLGAAALYIGYNNPDMFGGFYQKGEKRKDGQPKAMEIRVGNHNIPAWLFESPIFQVFQLGATTRHLIDYYSVNPKKGDAFNAIGGTALGLTEELPFVGQGVRLNELFGKPDERQYYLGELAKNTVDPLLLQQIAKWQDEDKKRYPKTIGEHVETGLPYLRENVSGSKNGSSTATPKSSNQSANDQAKKNMEKAKKFSIKK